MIQDIELPVDLFKYIQIIRPRRYTFELNGKSGAVGYLVEIRISDAAWFNYVSQPYFIHRLETAMTNIIGTWLARRVKFGDRRFGESDHTILMRFCESHVEIDITPDQAAIAADMLFEQFVRFGAQVIQQE